MKLLGWLLQPFRCVTINQAICLCVQMKFLKKFCRLCVM